MKKQDDGRSLHYLQTLTREHRIIPVPFLPITYEARDYKSPVTPSSMDDIAKNDLTRGFVPTR